MRTALITGANSGLGYECARAIARNREWTVVIACRDSAKSRQAVRRIIGSTGARPTRDGNRRIVDIELDLASLDSVRECVYPSRWTSLPPLAAVICNAGIQLNTSSQASQDGFERTFAVNHLGHFLLVNSLLPLLDSPARILFVSSGTHDPRRLTGMPSPRYSSARQLAFPTLSKSERAARYQGRRAYTTSKLCNVLCAYELNRRFRMTSPEDPRHDTTVNAFDPGLMPGSGLARDYGALAQAAWRYLLPVLTDLPINAHTTKQSGEALARLAIDPEYDGVTGQYFEGVAAVRSSDASYDRDLAKDLWDTSVELSGLGEDWFI